MMNTLTKGLVLSTLALMTIVSLVPRASAEDGFADHHPRRSEVMRRDNREMREIRDDRGHLGGQYNKLRREDFAIRRQEHRMARENGGYITPGQQRRLNHEENHLEHQINRADGGR